MRPSGPGDLLAGNFAIMADSSCVVKGALSMESCSGESVGKFISLRNECISALDG